MNNAFVESFHLVNSSVIPCSDLMFPKQLVVP